jgi:hypothetical protein
MKHDAVKLRTLVLARLRNFQSVRLTSTVFELQCDYHALFLERERRHNGGRVNLLS